MASDTESPELSSAFERLLRHRDLSLFLPFLLGFNTNPDQEGVVVIEGAASLDPLLRGLATKNGHPPALKVSIETMPSVAITDIGDGDSECSICLEAWELGRVVKEVHCKHRFHGDCIEKWLGIHGSCPVCRYKMPVDEEEFGKEEGSPRNRRRGKREEKN